MTLCCVQNWKQFASISSGCNFSTNLAPLPPSQVIVGVNICLVLRQPRIESAKPAAGSCLVHLATFSEKQTNVLCLFCSPCAYPHIQRLWCHDLENDLIAQLFLKYSVSAGLTRSNTVAITYFVFRPGLCLNKNPEQHSVLNIGFTFQGNAISKCVPCIEISFEFKWF